MYQQNYETLNVKGRVKSIVCTNYDQFVPNSKLTNYITKMVAGFGTGT